MGLQHEIIAKTKPTLYHNQRVNLNKQSLVSYCLYLFNQGHNSSVN